jgi:phage gp46-like protein
MTDIRLVYDNQPGTANYGFADFQVVGAALDQTNDLATAVIVSLFSDRLCDPSDPLPAHDDDRRGWWGDSYAEKSGDLIGSRLWLLHRTKSDNTLPARARGYILEALQWLLDGGVVGGVDATCFFLPNATAGLGGGAVTQRRLGATVTLYQHGLQPPALSFQWVWQQIGFV